MNSQNTIAQVSEVSLGDTESIVLSCTVTQSESYSIIVQDSKGSVHLQKTGELQVGTNEVILSTTNLKSGNYSGWIYIGEDTFIRQFELKKQKASKKSSWSSVFKNFFG